MKSWRVGTFSMGISLIFLGVFLVLTQLFHWNAATVMVSWWPVLLIVLGIEILLSLYFSKQEKPMLKYDFLSIIFVGIIGAVGIGLTIVTTTGVLDKVTTSIKAVQKTVDLPSFEKAIGENIKRIVVESGRYPIRIEGTSEKNVSIFGTYQGDIASKQDKLKSYEDYLMVKEKGDTLYIKIKDLPDPHQPLMNQMNMNSTLLIPSNLKLEVTGDNNEITLKLRSLANHWSIDSANTVNVAFEDQANVSIHTEDVSEMTGIAHADQHKKKSSDYRFGSGKYQLDFIRTAFVNVTKNP
ncbi:LiaF transmembrane domain-containing protein [Heyndrickxia sporothermodurans]